MALPGPTSAKNLMLSPAATELSAGDALAQQLQDQLAQRRKLQQLAVKGAGTPFTGASVMDLGLTNNG
jgi:hypothetical protein